MKIVLLIFAAIQVTTLQGSPMKCMDREVNYLLVVMPNPNVRNDWILFPKLLRYKTVIKNNSKELTEQDEYKKEDYWSSTTDDVKWMEEIKDFLASSIMFKENFELAGQEKTGKNENSSKKDEDWMQELEEYFRSKYSSSPYSFVKKGSKISPVKEKMKDKKVEYWSKMDGKWAQDIRDHMRENYSPEAVAQKFPKKNKYDKINVTATSSTEEKEKIKDLELGSSRKHKKEKTKNKTNSNWESTVATSKELQNLFGETPESGKLEPELEEEKENFSSDGDMPVEIKEQLDKLDMFQATGKLHRPESSLAGENVNDETIISKIIKSKKSKTKGNRTKVKEKIIFLPKNYKTKEQNSTINSFSEASTASKTESSKDLEKISKNFYGKQEKEENVKSGVDSEDEMEKQSESNSSLMDGEGININDANVSAVSNEKKNTGNSATLIITNDAGRETFHSSLLGSSNEKMTSKQSSEEKFDLFGKEPVHVLFVGYGKKKKTKNPTLISSPQNIGKTLNDKKSSEESGEFHQNVQEFGKFNGKFKYKNPYGLAKKLWKEQGQPVVVVQPNKRFTSV